MDVSRDSVALLFAVAALVIGGYGLFKGSLTFLVGESGPSNGIEITGNRAKIVSLVFICAGVALPFSRTAGLLLVLAAIALAWLFSR